MVGDVETIIRSTGPFLRWTAAVLWVVVTVGAFALSLSGTALTRRAWLSVVALGVFFTIETAFPLRFALTDLLRDAVRAVGGEDAYRNRRVFQVVVIFGLVLPTAGWIGWRFSRIRGVRWAAKIALIGVAVMLTGLILETISLHHIDQYPGVYRGFRVSGLGLALLGAGAGWAGRRSI